MIKNNLITLRDYTLVGPQKGNMNVPSKCHETNVTDCHELDNKTISTVKPLITMNSHADPKGSENIKQA